MDAIQALQRTPLFGELDGPDLEALATRAVERRVNRGEILFMAGDPAGGLYVVVEGSIRAYRVNADGREQTLHVEKAGATLAEVAVFDEGCYPSTSGRRGLGPSVYRKARRFESLPGTAPNQCSGAKAARPPGAKLRRAGRVAVAQGRRPSPGGASV